jgi:stage V sporulation protein G
MEITEVRVNVQNEEVLKAFVSITLDHEFVIRGLKVIQGMDGRFVAMPARKKKDGSFQDIAHPINRETRLYLERVVLDAYDEEVARSEGLIEQDAGQETENPTEEEISR